MKKLVKITLFTIGGLFTLVLLAAILIPVFFKEDIQKAIDTELDKNLNATVFYDTESFSLSLFRSFPNLSVSMGNFGIVGKAPFETDTLAAVKNFELVVDVMSLFGDITVNKVQLDEPKIFVLVLEDGQANYDIAIPSEEEPEEEESSAPSTLKVSINRWEINDAKVVYYDQSMHFYTVLEGLTHTGGGNLNADVFEMVTKTTVKALSLGMEGTEYISGKTLNADITMQMDMANMKFTFAENRVALNDFGFGFDGFISMPDEDIAMDITFKGAEIDMKSVLSLIPGAYQEYLDGISGSGEINFNGFVRGTYNETSMPAVQANLGIKNGKVSTPDLPSPLEKIMTSMTFDYPSADLRETSIKLDYSSELAGQVTALKLLFKDLEDYYWDVDFNAKLDLSKAAKILPLSDSELKGLVDARLLTKGRMSDLEAEKWDKLPTSGSMQVSDLYFKGPDLPQGFGIKKMDAVFDPTKVELRTFDAIAGRSDFQLGGGLYNYLAFALKDDEKLTGNLNFTSRLLDVDEWMPETAEVEEVVEEDPTTLEVIRIPTNIDFVLASSLKEIKYTNLTLKDFAGKILVQEGSVILDKTTFGLLDGQFTMSGAYASAPDVPTFNFDFGIKNLSIPKSFQAFTPIQKLVPVAEKTTGNFSSTFNAKGKLGADMMPVMMSLDAGGMVQIAEATVARIEVLDAVRNIANFKMDETNAQHLAQLKDVLLSMEIKDGRLSVQPFKLMISGNETVVSGSSGLDGSLDYLMAMKVPSGQTGQLVNNALSKLTSGTPVVSEFIELDLGIGGNYNKPVVRLLRAKPIAGKGNLTASVKEQLQQTKEEKLAEAKEQLTEEVAAATDSLKAKAAEAAKKAEEEAKKKAEEAAKDKLKELFKKKNDN